MKHLKFIATTSLLITLLALSANGAEDRPNIIWLMAEDISLDLECYGMKGVQTPVLNGLAEDGIKFTNAYTTNPICSPSRSAMMTGAHQNKINAQHHRSNRDVPLRKGVYPFTYYLRQAGYTCILGHNLVMDKGTKTDVNFQSTQTGPYDGMSQFGLFDRVADYSNLKGPFFAQIQLKATHRGDWWDKVRAQSPDPVRLDEIELPPFMADTSVTRLDWAKYLDQMEYIDHETSLLIKELKEKGLFENTIIVFIGDNGRCNIRGKGYLNDPGLHIPLIIYGPKWIPGGQVRDDFVSATDITATILEWAGVKIPDFMTGQSIFHASSPRQFTYGARDLWDEVMEKSRSLYRDQYHYILHRMPEVPFDAHQAYLEFYRPAVHAMRTLKAQGKLNQDQSLFFADHKPPEELYDMSKDPFELRNLASEPHYKKVTATLRKELTRIETDYQSKDTTFHPVTPASVDILEWVKETYPDAYQRMREGEEIGFGHFGSLYRATMKKKKR